MSNHPPFPRTPIADAVQQFGRIVAQGPLASFVCATPDALTYAGKATSAEFAMSEMIAKRICEWAQSMGFPALDPLTVSQDVMTAHIYDAPLNLRAMYAHGDPGDVAQFVAQLGLRLDRLTGKVRDGWRGKFHA